MNGVAVCPAIDLNFTASLGENLYTFQTFNEELKA